MIRFELLDKTHIDEVLEIERMCFNEEAWSRKMFESELKNNISVFIVGVDEKNNSVVCYGGMWLIVDIGEITNIAVSPKLQRQGLGEKIISLLTDICAERGIASVNLEVKSTNEPAICLYKKSGFEIVGKRAEYYRDRSDALLMTKSI